MDLRLVEYDLVVDEGFGNSGAKVRDAHFVQAVADKQFGIADIFYELEIRTAEVGAYGFDIPGRSVQDVDAVVAGGECEIPVRSHASPERGERRGLRHVGQLSGRFVILPDTAGRRQPYGTVGSDVDIRNVDVA